MDGRETIAHRSLRRAALLWMTALLTGAGAITVVVSFRHAYNEAAVFLDGQLRQIALNAGDAVPPANAPPAADTDPEDQFAITIWGEDGRLIRASPADAPVPRQQAPGFGDVMADGERWRVYATGGPGRTAQVAQRDAVREEIATNAAVDAAVPIVVLIPLSWLVVGWTMTRVLGRLDALAHDLETRSAAAGGPLPLTGIPTEVVPLVRSMNGLILRLRNAIDTQKRFLADAAHELRTPLAAMQIQVDSLRDAGGPEQQAGLAALAAGTHRASVLVNQLLHLARLDGPAPVPNDVVDLNAVLMTCVSDHVAIAQAKGVNVGLHLGQPCVCPGSATELRVLLANLVDNAVRYTPAGGDVDVSVRRTDGQVAAEVLDTGPGLPAGAETRIFDRFYRAAPAGVEGSGLGLAIARRIAERHGFRLTVENRADHHTGVCARIVIPAPKDAKAAHSLLTFPS